MDRDVVVKPCRSQEMDLTEGLLSSRSLPGCPGETTIKFSTASKVFKGEDEMFVMHNEKVSEESAAWSVFMVCDGHCGSEAAVYVTKNLWPILKEKLPKSAPPTENGNGTTVTLALICNWTLTIANVGDSDAVLDTLNSHLEVSVSHRLNSNEDEKCRLRNAGISLGKLAHCLSRSSGSEKEGLGPIRCWPGGLANSRSIGDKHAGEEINAVPHIQHFFLPQQGARLILASDGLWDAVKHANAVNTTRHTPTQLAADRLIAGALCQNGWAFHDDTSVIVVEISPKNGQEFFALGKRLRKRSKPHKRLMKMILCRGPAPVEPEEHALGLATQFGHVND